MHLLNMKQFIPQKLYDQILKNMPIACVDVAIVSEEAVFLVKRKDDPAKGEWWVPGGRVLKGEMMKETAIRKCRDEVGIDCDAGPIIYTAETIFSDGPDNIPIHSINSCFYMKPKNGKLSVKLDMLHHEDCKWVKSIPGGVHQYVERCLLAAGLNK